MAESPSLITLDVQKVEELIREAVEHLRKRKARPDLERICRLLDRHHNVAAPQAEAALDRMVAAGVLVRVEFKGNFSFRNVRNSVSKPGRKAGLKPKLKVKTVRTLIHDKKIKIVHLSTGRNSVNDSRRLGSAVRQLLAASAKLRRAPPMPAGSRSSKRSDKKSVGVTGETAHAGSIGVRLDEIQRQLVSPENRWTAPNKKFADEKVLLEALRREVATGTMRRLSDGSFVMTSDGSPDAEVDDEDEPTATTKRTLLGSPTVSSTPTKLAEPVLPFAIKSVPKFKTTTTTTTTTTTSKAKKSASKRPAVPVRRVTLAARRKIGKADRPSKIKKSDTEESSSEEISANSCPAAVVVDTPPTRVVDTKRKLSVMETAEVSPSEQSTTPSSSKLRSKVVEVEPFRVPVVSSKISKCPVVSPRISSRLNKRKRFKKTHGPDFVENYDSSFEEPISKCDYCLLTESCNRLGEREELLVCKDCSAKAHPSCMNYSEELALRSRRSPWQCLDCKTCFVCQESENADSMLFCDSCDKGFHMGCHRPYVTEKPTGKWMCDQCLKESNQRNGGTICSNTGEEPEAVADEVDENGIDDDDAAGDATDVDSDQQQPSLSQQPPSPAAAADTTPEDPDEEKPSSSAEGESTKCAVDGLVGLPTPCDSPVPEATQNKQPFSNHFGQEINFNDDKENVLADNVPDATDWSIEEVENYLTSLGFAEQAKSFKDQEIDGRSLLLIKRNDILTGLSLKLGPALKIYKHVRRLQVKHAIECSK